MSTSLVVALIRIAIANGALHDTASPRISRDVRGGAPAPRGGYWTGPHLDGCRTHGRTCSVTLRDRERAVGGPHRLAGCRPVLGLGKCVSGDRRRRRADGAVRFADPADDRCRGCAAV